MAKPGDQIAEILHLRHQAIAQREVLQSPQTVRELIEDSIPLLAELCAGVGVDDRRHITSRSREEETLLRFFANTEVEEGCPQ